MNNLESKAAALRVPGPLAPEGCNFTVAAVTRDDADLG